MLFAPRLRDSRCQTQLHQVDTLLPSPLYPCRSYLGYETVHVELVGAREEVEGASHQRIVAHRALVLSFHQSVPETNAAFIFLPGKVRADMGTSQPQPPFWSMSTTTHTKNWALDRLGFECRARLEDVVCSHLSRVARTLPQFVQCSVL